MVKVHVVTDDRYPSSAIGEFEPCFNTWGLDRVRRRVFLFLAFLALCFFCFGVFGLYFIALLRLLQCAGGLEVRSREVEQVHLERIRAEQRTRINRGSVRVLRQALQPLLENGPGIDRFRGHDELQAYLNHSRHDRAQVLVHLVTRRTR